MNKKDTLAIIAAVVFAILFYMQPPGLNFLLFTILFTFFLARTEPSAVRSPGWWSVAILTNVAGLGVLLVDEILPVLASVASMLVLAAKTLSPRVSVAMGGFMSGLNFFFSPFTTFRRIFWREQNSSEDAGKSRGIIVLWTAGAFAIAFLFLMLYRNANPLFREYVYEFDASWVGGWMLCAFLGFVIIGGLLHFSDFLDLMKWDEHQPSVLVSGQRGGTTVKRDTVIVTVLFTMLNAMLLIINVLDMNNIIRGAGLPQGITLSDFVHDAVESIILSIVIAVGLLMWFFRGELNFVRGSRALKMLVLAWIVQNVMMTGSAIYRNALYIDSYQLTDQRIGVYVFLGLCVFGLVFTAIKIFTNRSAWYLVRVNTMTWLAVLCILSAVPWSRVITRYNIAHADASRPLDIPYLLEFGHANLDLVAPIVMENWGELTGYEHRQFTERVRTWIPWRNLKWQSFNVSRAMMNRKMEDMLSAGKIHSLAVLFGTDLLRLSHLKGIRNLELDSATGHEILVLFPDLESLTYKRHDIKWDEFPYLVNVKTIHAAAETVDVRSCKALKRATALRTLHVRRITLEGLKELNGHPSLREVQVKDLDLPESEFLRNSNLSFKTTITK